MTVKYVSILTLYAKPLQLKYLWAIVQVIDMSHRIIFRHFILLLLSIFILTACESWLPNAHRPDFTQGNAIKREALDKIQIGMKASDIVPILGNPSLKDPFHANRWDYMYRFLPGRGENVQSRLTLYFENGVLTRIDDSEYREPESFKDKASDEPAPVEAVPGPEPD